MQPLKIFFVEDDRYFRSSVAHELAHYGEVTEAENLGMAINILNRRHFDVAFIDLNLTDSDLFEGLKIVELCQQKNITSAVLTSHESKSVIGRAFEAGCNNYFAKSKVESDVHKEIGGFLKGLMKDDITQLIREKFITRDEGLISRLKYLHEQALVPDQNIMITGPTGVGKTRIAKLIHDMTDEKKPFVHLNLAELPENLIESELFGHKKGSFTGATQDKKGILELANGGTLFLDEIGATPLHIQKKLLRVLEDKTFMPVGGTEVCSSDFRLITATCDDLSELINSARFRVDFYFRIKGIEVEIPPLHKRRKDIIPLVDYFVSLSPRKIVLSEEAENSLRNYQWYGNIRELENLIRELSHSSKGRVEKEDLPSYIIRNENPFEKKASDENTYLSGKMKDFIQENGLPALIKEIEKEAMQDALNLAGGKINEVGRKLKISKSLLYRIHKDLTAEGAFL